MRGSHSQGRVWQVVDKGIKLVDDPFPPSGIENGKEKRWPKEVCCLEHLKDLKSHPQIVVRSHIMVKRPCPQHQDADPEDLEDPSHGENPSERGELDGIVNSAFASSN